MSDAISRLDEELTDDELDTLVEMVKARTEGRLTRRDVVKSGGILAALGLSGGAFAGSASADASTSDSDGNIGEPGNRVDAFLDGADATTVDADDLRGDYPGKVRAVADGRVVSTYDPSATTDPIQQARDDIAATTPASGTVEFLGTIDQSTQLDWRDSTDINLLGYGPRASIINFTDGTNKGFLWSKTQSCNFTSFRVAGQLSGNSDAVFRVDDTGSGNLKVNNNVVDLFDVRNWYGNFLEVVGGAAPFQNSIAPSFGAMNTIDAGDETAMINWAVGGRENVFGPLAVNPTDSVSGKDSQIYDDTSGSDNSALFVWLNLGGTVGPIADANGGLTVQACNFEPGSQNTTTHDLFTLRGATTPQRIYHVETAASPTFDSVYSLQSAGNAHLTSPWFRDSATVNVAIVDIQNSPPGGQGTAYYYGPAGNIVNNSGETNGSVRSMATAGGANG